MKYRLCEGNIHCTNTIGSYKCGCIDGYTSYLAANLSVNDPNCVDIDECKKPRVLHDTKTTIVIPVRELPLVMFNPIQAWYLSP